MCHKSVKIWILEYRNADWRKRGIGEDPRSEQTSVKQFAKGGKLNSGRLDDRVDKA